MNVFSILISIVAAAVAGFSMLTSFDANDQTQKLGASQKISELTSYTNPDDADSLPIVDAANATTKRITWGNATSSLGTYFSTVYSPIFSTSAGLAGLISDENGTGNFVLSSSTALTSARLNAPVLDVAGTDATGDIYYNGGSGLLTRLAIGGGTSYYLRTSAGGVPEWDNTGIMTNPQTASSTFLATTTAQKGVKTLGVNIFYDFQAGETITGQSLPQPVYVSTTTGQVFLSDANEKPEEQFVGFAVSGAASGATTTVQIAGIVQGFTGLSRGLKYYVSDSVGTISSTVGTNEVLVGTAISPTEILIDGEVGGNWQYLGSSTFTASYGNLTACSATATTSPLGRNFIVTTTVQNGGTPEKWQDNFVLTRVGVTSLTSSYAANNAAYSNSVTVSLSGDVVTMTGAGVSDASTNQACSGTLYFYR